MKTKISTTLAVAAVAALACASQAQAQKKATKTAAPAAAAPAAGPAQPAPIQLTANIPGVCVLNQQGIIGGSTVGAYVIDRLKQLNAVVQSEITTVQTGIQTDAKALDGQKATLTPEVYSQRFQALEQREAQLQQTGQLRQREWDATQQKAFGRIMQAASPMIGQIIVQRSCGLVLDGAAVLVANPAMDLTPAVIAQLNGVLTQFAFDREHLDPNAAPGN